MVKQIVNNSGTDYKSAPTERSKDVIPAKKESSTSYENDYQYWIPGQMG